MPPRSGARRRSVAPGRGARLGHLRRFTSAGTYQFWADYTGDDNNDAATSPCDSEIVVVGKNSPAFSTQVMDTNGTDDKGDDTQVANGGSPRRSGPRSTTPPR